ncbi:MAG: hypothetical protein KF878_23755 [Planctomycetes bacterium]|nr:hypothetical protein [Planctomycetota bacterium]
MRLAALSFALCLVAGSGLARAQDDGDALVKARLGSEFGAVWPGRETTLAVVLEVDPGWHIYWKNPGDAGMPTTVRLDLPPGLEAGEVQWPAPERFVHEGIASYGYEGAVTLLVPLRAAADLAAGAVTIEGRVDWLVCNPDGCLPGGADVAVRLHVATGPAAPTPTADAKRIAAARRALPKPAPDGLRAAWRAAGRDRALTLEVPGAAGLVFFPWVPEDVAPLDMATRGAADGPRLELLYPKTYTGRVAGVLAVRRADGAVTHHEVEAPAPRE